MEQQLEQQNLRQQQDRTLPWEEYQPKVLNIGGGDQIVGYP
jgi:hypothetical protein